MSRKPLANPDSLPLFDAPRPGSNLPEFTVSDLSRQLKKTVEETFGLVRVKGEIGSCKLHSSGHMYLSLKDETAVLDAVCWKGNVSRLGIRPEIGMEVVCTGKLTTYMGSSKYQMIIESMALAGMGALLKMLEERRQKLAAEGLFNAERKRKLPYLPNVIGVVTSPTGAVIRDILHRLEDRFPRRVLVWPVAVQGDNAAAQVAAAIRGFNALPDTGPVPRPDVLIVARGGGSVEDLMPFNEEIVVRAAAESRIPLISAVGHETDTTLIDYAADVRAPTPTAAAEMAVPVRANLLAQVLDDGARLEAAMLRMTGERQERLALLSRALGDPARLLEPLMQRLDERAERLGLAWQGYLTRVVARLREAAGRLRHPRDLLELARQQLAERDKRRVLAGQTLRTRAASSLAELSGRLRHPRDLVGMAAQRLQNQTHRLQASGRERLLQTEKRLERLSAMLDVLSPRAVLGRGYGLIHDAQGRLVTNVTALQAGERVRIELQDGVRGARVEE